jgi:hypothetical protein
MVYGDDEQVVNETYNNVELAGRRMDRSVSGW